MVQRLVYRSRHSYATKWNLYRIVKIPGGKEIKVYHKRNTQRRHPIITHPKCPICCPTDKRMYGPPEYKRPSESRLSRNLRKVNRAYGGVLAGSAVRERIIRAFLVEEKKILKKGLKLQKPKIIRSNPRTWNHINQDFKSQKTKMALVRGLMAAKKILGIPGGREEECEESVETPKR